MIETETATIQSKAIFSIDRKHRYLLERCWDDRKKKATVIMINPSFADELKTDLSILKLMNFLIDHDYGTLRVVNLYAFISTDPSQLKKNPDAVGELNDQYIKESIENTDLIIIAWGVERDKYKVRKNQLKMLLLNSKPTIKGFIDEEGRIGRHPSRINKLNLADYSWE